MRRFPVLVLVIGLILIGVGLNYSSLEQKIQQLEDFRTAARAPEPSAQRRVTVERERREAEERQARQREREMEQRRKAEAALQEQRRKAEEELRALRQEMVERQREKETIRRLGPPQREELQLYDQLTASMRSARYAFNHPDVMYLTRRHQITLTLAADESAALEALGRQFDKGAEGTVKTGETRYAPVMIATLRGKDFKIDPPDGKEQLVLLAAKGPTEWTWFVEPLETGTNKLLTLQLSARLDRSNEHLPPLMIKTFEARINVDVRVWDSVLIHARRMTPIAQALTGVGGLIAVIGFIGTTRRWLRGTGAARQVDS